MLQILQTFAFLALDSLSEPAIACACGRRLEERLLECARVYREHKGANTHTKSHTPFSVTTNIFLTPFTILQQKVIER